MVQLDKLSVQCSAVSAYMNFLKVQKGYTDQNINNLLIELGTMYDAKCIDQLSKMSVTASQEDLLHVLVRTGSTIISETAEAQGYPDPKGLFDGLMDVMEEELRGLVLGAGQ